MIIFAAWLQLASASASATEPDWSANVAIPLTGRPNPYNWDEATLAQKIRLGKLRALNYPVAVTGLRMPARPMMKLLDLEPGDPYFGLVKAALGLKRDFKNFKGFWKWLGLNEYPAGEKEAEYEIPFPDGVRPDHPMGVSISSRIGGDGKNFSGGEGDQWVAESSVRTIRGDSAIIMVSCAACHSATLFGKPVLGLTNRFSRANEFFMLGQEGFHRMGPTTFQLVSGANREERGLYSYTREHIQSVGLKKPAALGLDTSLAQVALSLAKRKPGPWAERSPETQAHPRPNLLDTLVADSKPAVWWNVKYKNRWLSDGSVLSGNPVFTNFLWNEIGRGADLPELVKWLDDNRTVVEELTTAVFANEPPKWRNYLPAGAIRVERARRGAELFAQNCAHCHGDYIKDWSHGTDTVEVHYHAQTPVKDVGTDPGRHEGMRALAEALNPLEFSQRNHIVIEEQKGYVPPPLVGIWARYPYLHNNSIPNLCALMTPPAERPRVYYMGQPVEPGRDYDLDCVGYPSADAAPAEWKKDPVYRYETGRPGMSNAGHYDRIFTQDGRERYTPEQKKDLIEFLKTL